MNDTALKNKVIQTLLDIVPYLEIAHHIPGRIRLRISFSGIGALQGVDLGDQVNQIPGILSARVNALALSAVVEYDPERLDPGLWEALAGLKDQPEQTKEVVDRLLALWESD